MGVVVENRQNILNLQELEEHRDRAGRLRDKTEDVRELEGTGSDAALNDRALRVDRSLVPRGTMESGRFNLFGRCRRGSVSNTVTDKSLSAPIHTVTDTTYGNTWSVGGNKMKLNPKIATDGLDTERSVKSDEEQGDEVDRLEPGLHLDCEPLTATTTTTMKKPRKKSEDNINDVSNDSNPIVIDTPLRNGEVAADDSGDAEVLASTRGMKGKNREEERKQRQEEVKNNDRLSRNASHGLCTPAKSRSQSERVVEASEASEADLSGSIPKSLNGPSEPGFMNEADDQPSPLESHPDSLSQSPASMYYSMAPEVPITHGLKPHYSEEDISSIRQCTENSKGLVKKSSKSQGSLPEEEMVRLTAQWFLSVVPHESTNTELRVRPNSGEPSSSRAQAEETAKTLLLNWTNVDPDLISGEEKYGFWDASEDSSRPYGPTRDETIFNQPYQMSYTPQAYPTYTPQSWYSTPVLTAPLPQTERESDSEELARLKKLILDEKAEQDMRAAAVAAATPPAAQVAPIVSEELLEEDMQHRNTYMEAVDSMQMEQEHHALWKAEPPRLQPVIMRDWLGRKFIFPVDMCQTWEVSNLNLT